MKKKIMVVLIGFALIPLLMAEMCEGPCELENTGDVNLIILATDACYVEDSQTHEVIFKDNPFDANLNITGIIGDLSAENNKDLKPMNINVEPISSVNFSQGTPFTTDIGLTSDDCAFKIFRSNTHIKNISFEDYDTDFGVCVYAKGVILENITFDGISNGTALKLFKGASVILKNPTFTDNKTKIEAPDGSYIIMTGDDSDCGKTWHKWGQGCSNKTVDETFYNSFNDYISDKELLSKTVCGDNNAVFSATGCACKDDYIDDPETDELDCIACKNKDDKQIKDGKCVCTDDALTLGSDDLCTNTCNSPNEQSKDDVCVCKTGYGRYFFDGMSAETVEKNPCVLCGTSGGKTSTDGTYCSCNVNYHRNLKGSCVADTVIDCGTNASKVGNTCQCDSCSTYTWAWSESQAALDAGPSCVKNADACTAPPDCAALGKQKNMNLVANADNTACVEIGASGKGDCQLNPNAGGTTALQAMLPFITILTTSIGMRFSRKR